jgi:hypothetical protein
MVGSCEHGIYRLGSKNVANALTNRGTVIIRDLIPWI